jgi:2-dehydropantoate 2-reductase
MTTNVAQKPLNIAVIGTGGVGGYFGGRLAQAGHKVTFVARGEHLKALQNQGLRVSSIDGDFAIENIVATDHIDSIPVQDLVIFATKTWQLVDVAERIKNAVADDTFLIPLLNGVDAPAQLIKMFDKKQVLGGLCKIISFIEAPGVIKHTGAMPYVVFGELNGDISQRCQRLSKAFEQAQIKHKLSSTILADMWEKFLFISAMSALGTITSSPIGSIRDNNTTRKALSDVMTEIHALAKTMDIEIQDGIVDKTMQFVDKLPSQSTTSMQRDIASGKLSEIEAQLGTVVKLAKEYNVKTPISDLIYAAICLQVNG